MTLKERILRYFQRNPTLWIASGEIQRLVAQKTKYTPQTAGRILRTLETTAQIEVDYRKGHAWYRFGNIEKRMVDWFDSI